MDMLIGGLADYGMAGLFLMFMVWNYLQNQKRMDDMSDKFIENIEKLRKENKDNEDHIRVRYDKVIQVYQSDKDTLLSDLKDTIKNLSSTIQKLEELEKTSMVKIDEIDVNVDEIKKVLERTEQERKAEKEAALIALAHARKNN